MPRIRTVKPQYWSTPDPPSRDARLLFIAMWNWADDEGIGTANPKELAAFAFPNDDDITPVVVQGLLREISGSFHVAFYTVGGRPYYFVENFLDHQVINKPTPSKRPKLADAEHLLYQEVYETPVVLPEPSMDAGGLERRNSGTQEKEPRGCFERASYEPDAGARASQQELEPQDDPYVLGTSEQADLSPPVKLGASRLVATVLPRTFGNDAVRTGLRIEASALLSGGSSEDDVAECLRLWLTKDHLGVRALPSLMAEVHKMRLPKATAYERKAAANAAVIETLIQKGQNV